MLERSPSTAPERSTEWSVEAMIPPAAVFGMWASALAGTAKGSDTTYSDFATLNTEWLDFLNRRWREDIKLCQQLGECKSPQELWGIYAAFWQKSFDDYQKEYAVMAKMSSRLVNNGMLEAQSQMQRAAHKVEPPSTSA